MAPHPEAGHANAARMLSCGLRHVLGVMPDLMSLQDLAKHMGTDGAATDALREQLDMAVAEKAAALKDVEYLSAQLQSVLDQRDNHNGEVGR